MLSPYQGSALPLSYGSRPIRPFARQILRENAAILAIW
jgi:hypothetical protein